MSEHDFEPVHGLPETLPEGETVLWQGAPDWRALAQRAFHGRSVAIYFALLAVWAGVSASSGGAPAALQAVLSVAIAAALVLGLICGLAALNARTTVYTITSKRVVLRFGVALTKAINIPFSIVDGVALKAFKDGTGDIALTLAAPSKIAYLLLWPHARPWALVNPQPALRAVPDAAVAAEALTDALRGAVASRRAANTPETMEPTAQAAFAPA